MNSSLSNLMDTNFPYGEMMYFLLICKAAILDSNKTEYIENFFFQIMQPLAIRKYFFLIWFCTLLNPELECVSLFTKWREVGGSFFISIFEAELHNKVMIYSKERAFDAFSKFILKCLPFNYQFLPHLLWKFWTRIRFFWKNSRTAFIKKICSRTKFSWLNLLRRINF